MVQIGPAWAGVGLAWARRESGVGPEWARREPG